MFVDAVAEAQAGERQMRRLFADEPVRQRGHATVRRDHLQEDFRGLQGAVRGDAAFGGQEELLVDVKALDRYRVGEQGFVGKVFRLHGVFRRQRVVARDDQHLFVGEDGQVVQAGGLYRVGGDEDIDFVGEQRACAFELELLFDVHINPRPRFQVGRDDFQKPLVAGMAFHANAQEATLAARVVAKLFFEVVKLRQDVLREAVQALARLGQAQVAAVFVPKRRTQLFFQFFDGVAER